MDNAQKSLSPKMAGRKVRQGATYRGVHLQRAEGRTQFTSEQVEQAVRKAVMKNADSLFQRAKA